MKNCFYKLRSQLSVIYGIFPLVFLLACSGGGDSEIKGPDFVDPFNKVDEQVALLTYIGNEFMLPSYDAFNQQTVSFIEQADQFCNKQNLTNTDLVPIRADWRLLMDAWQRIQIMRFGPITNSNYIFRIQFFPDSNDAVPNNVNSVLANNPSITEAILANSSVGAQGIPALEYLMFGDDAQIIQTFTTDIDAAKRCQLVTSIAANLNTIANDLVNRWATTGEDFINDFIGTHVANTSDTSLIDAMISDVVNTMVEQAQFLVLSKLRPAQADMIPGTIDAAESWRSLHSLQNLVINIQAFSDLYGADDVAFSRFLNRVVQADILDDNMRERINNMLNQLTAITLPLSEAIGDEAQRVMVESFIVEVESFVAKLEGDFAAGMEATIGFNGNDGD